RYRTDFPFPLAAECRGTWQNPGRELWHIRWQRDGKWSRTVMVGVEENQFEQSGSAWRRTGRGIETDILEQARAVAGNATWELVEEREERLIYRFRPVLPLLDPTGRKSFVGIVVIDRSSGVPVTIHCRDSTKTAEWELRLFGFNRPARIPEPFVAAQRVRAEPEKRVGGKVLTGAVRTITARLTDLDWEYRLRRIREGLELLFTEAHQRRLLELLFSVCRVEIWQAVRLLEGQEGLDSLPVVFVGGDAARRIALKKLVATNPGLEAVPDLSLPVEPKLAITLHPSLLDTSATYALVVDGKAQSVVVPEPGLQGWTLRFAGLGNEEAVKVVAACARHEPLPTDFSVTVGE
ncbi:MAG: hypothetical protein ABIK44_04430, partial [candidate division WOR-3 bacterium]